MAGEVLKNGKIGYNLIGGGDGVLRLPRLLTDQTDGEGTRMMKAHRAIWLLSALLLCVQWASAQDNLPSLPATADSFETELSASLPDHWLILQPGEIVTFVANPVLDGMAESSNWHALNGELLSVSAEGVVYQAPDGRDETFDVLIWHNPLTGQWAIVAVTLVCETESVPACMESQLLCSVPVSSNAGVQIFALSLAQGGSGFNICLSGRPLNPPPLDRRCSGGSTTTSRTKFFRRCDPWSHCRTIIVDAAIATRVWRIFRIRLSIGITVHIQKRRCIETKLTLQDCYRCVNGQWRYVGSRVWWRTTEFQEVDPNWGVLFCPIGPPRIRGGCVPSGNCPCP